MATHRIGQPDCFDLELVCVLPLGRIAISHFVPPYSRSYQLLAVRGIEARSRLGNQIEGLQIVHFVPRKRSALKMTEAELRLIAKAAIIGDSNQPVNG